ncbi:MAG: aspartate kinase [Coriobacteriales bacterium]|jgi:aspartate kinase|nr:aspartate kinase [Coriobacteriales bacterium]
MSSAASPFVVMKFGGTSVASAEGRDNIATRVRAEVNAGLKPVVVVSAMGRKGAPYATDTLLSLVDQRHCDKHELDVLMSVGEVISSVVVATHLSGQGIPAKALSGVDTGIHTNLIDGAASITDIDTAPIIALTNAGIVPVVTGFQGVDATGRLHTLGRGGSDTTACALGAALDASFVDIYTDVDGVFTADPRAIDEAKVLTRITADELFQMAAHGSKVVHAPAAELALQSGVNMRVRNTFSTAEGTQVVHVAPIKPDAIATAVTTVADIARIRVRLPYVKDDATAHMQTQTAVYRAMADAGISIDMFTPMNDRVVFSVKKDLAAQAVDILRGLDYKVALRDGLAKVTLVGSGMHGVPGVMAKVATSLAAAGIDILQVADSHATISLLVDEKDMLSAARALHSAFGL